MKIILLSRRFYWFLHFILIRIRYFCSESKTKFAVISAYSPLSPLEFPSPSPIPSLLLYFSHFSPSPPKPTHFLPPLLSFYITLSLCLALPFPLPHLPYPSPSYTLTLPSPFVSLPLIHYPSPFSSISSFFSPSFFHYSALSLIRPLIILSSTTLTPPFPLLLSQPLPFSIPLHY